MAVDRKSFLRITGLSLAALVTRKAAGAFAGPGPDQAASEPGLLTARRWAMVVDARKCLKKEGCDLCIRACNRSHNVPEISDPHHEVKWIWKERFKDAFISEQSDFANVMFQDKPFVVFCNHCDRPPCVRVCPTQATWKREDGIVMMDWHRCIGCRYCMAACPYGSRSFNWVDPRPYVKNLNVEFPTRTKGVVEKCTFCAERLALGKPPACVEACEPKALLFGDLEDPASAVRAALRSDFAIRRKAELGTAPEVYYIV
ncbi:MAG: 4Fe-4S dicluster domain-containing protein [Acidobacteriia bacterium]|nr:4Fe-4S dicluster domain-containing protein [Terriglobia bacterium]